MSPGWGGGGVEDIPICPSSICLTGLIPLFEVTLIFLTTVLTPKCLTPFFQGSRF